MYDVVKEFVLPPGSLWLILALGVALLAVGRRRAALATLSFGLVVFYVLSMPVVGGRLDALIQTAPPLTDEEARSASADAIVVLSAGLHYNSPEYGGMTVDDMSLERLRYAARLHRLTGLPILVSGGTPRGANVSLARAMQTSLAEDFGITEVICEERSLDTYQNAAFSTEILKARGARAILLVTHANHMPRAAAVFSNRGVTVIPAPTVFADTTFDTATSFIPRLSGLGGSHYALYEIIGRIWYALRH